MSLFSHWLSSESWSRFLEGINRLSLRAPRDSGWVHVGCWSSESPLQSSSLG